MPREQALRYLQDFMYVINGKWKLLILASIHDGNDRFRDIQRSLDPITTRVLSKELKELEQNKLIVRTVYDDSLRSVSYTPTEYSKSIIPIVEQMVLWAKDHRKKLAKK